MAWVVGHKPGRGSRALCDVTRLTSKCSRTHCEKRSRQRSWEKGFSHVCSLLKSISQVNFTQHGAFETHFLVLKQTTTALFLVLSGLILIFRTQFSFFFCTFHKSSEELLRMHCGSAWYGGVILIGSIRLNVHLHPSCGHWITFTHLSRSSHTLY